MREKSMKLPIIILVVGMIVAVAACLIVGIVREPVIKEHDFNYSVTYKLDGEVKTFNGVLKCSFDENGSGDEDPTLRYYTGEYTSNGEVLESQVITIGNKDGIKLYIVTSLDVDYLMGDPDIYEYENGHEDPYLEAINESGEGVDFTEKFDAEIISWEYPEPIENSFAFAGISHLYVGSMLAMVVVGFLTIIACVIFAKKADTVSYKAFDGLSIALNFAISLLVVPFLVVLIWFMQIVTSSDEILYQIFLCIPPLCTFGVAASVGLRRKGYSVSGLLVQLAAPVAFILSVVVESVIFNLFG